MGWGDDDDTDHSYRQERKSNEREYEVDKKFNRQASDVKSLQKEVRRLKMITEAL